MSHPTVQNLQSPHCVVPADRHARIRTVGSFEDLRTRRADGVGTNVGPVCREHVPEYLQALGEVRKKIGHGVGINGGLRKSIADVLRRRN